MVHYFRKIAAKITAKKLFMFENCFMTKPNIHSEKKPQVTSGDAR